MMPLEQMRAQLEGLQRTLDRRKLFMRIAAVVAVVVLGFAGWREWRFNEFAGDVDRIDAATTRANGQLKAENKELRRQLDETRQLLAEEKFVRTAIESERDALAVERFLAGLPSVVPNPTRSSSGDGGGTTTVFVPLESQADTTPTTTCRLNPLGVCIGKDR